MSTLPKQVSVWTPSRRSLLVHLVFGTAPDTGGPVSAVCGVVVAVGDAQFVMKSKLDPPQDQGQETGDTVRDTLKSPSDKGGRMTKNDEK